MAISFSVLLLHQSIFLQRVMSRFLGHPLPSPTRTGKKKNSVSLSRSVPTPRHPATRASAAVVPGAAAGPGASPRRCAGVGQAPTAAAEPPVAAVRRRGTGSCLSPSLSPCWRMHGVNRSAPWRGRPQSRLLHHSPLLILGERGHLAGSTVRYVPSPPASALLPVTATRYAHPFSPVPGMRGWPTKP